MPYIYDMTKYEWDESNEGDPLVLPAEQFEYLTVPAYSGSRKPVYFDEPAPQQPVQPSRSGGSFFDRILGRKPAEEDYRAQYRQKSTAILSVIIAALRAEGVRTAYLRYDGGNDEGFAWLDHVVLTSGEVIDCDGLADRLIAAGVGQKLEETGQAFDRETGERHEMKNVLSDWVATGWAAKLLGEGFGTGEYYMYGACKVDLETRLIEDDPAAAAVIQSGDFRVSGAG